MREQGLLEMFHDLEKTPGRGQGGTMPPRRQGARQGWSWRDSFPAAWKTDPHMEKLTSPPSRLEGTALRGTEANYLHNTWLIKWAFSPKLFMAVQSVQAVDQVLVLGTGLCISRFQAGGSSLEWVS